MNCKCGRSMEWDEFEGNYCPNCDDFVNDLVNPLPDPVVNQILSILFGV